MNPSDFTSYPWSSVFYKSESETIITNIMVILKRTGNEWRELSKEEYIVERKKDGGYTSSELPYFEKVQPYTTSAIKASRVSKSWAEIYDNDNPTLEQEASKQALETKAYNQKIMDFIAAKQDENLKAMSAEELQKLLK